MTTVNKLYLGDNIDPLYFGDSIEDFKIVELNDTLYQKIFLEHIVPKLGNNEYTGGNHKLLQLHLTKTIWLLARPNLSESSLFITNKKDMTKHFVTWQDENDNTINGLVRFKYGKHNSINYNEEITEDDFPDLLVVLPLPTEYCFSKENISLVKNHLSIYADTLNLNCTENDFVDLNWVKQNLTDKKLAIQTECISACQKILDSLNKKEEIYKSISSFYDGARTEIIKEFNSKLGFYNYEMIENHPLYGSTFKELEKKRNKAHSDLYLLADKQLIKYIASAPPEYAVICVRKIIGLDNIIKYCLDEDLANLLNNAEK